MSELNFSILIAVCVGVLGMYAWLLKRSYGRARTVLMIEGVVFSVLIIIVAVNTLVAQAETVVPGYTTDAQQDATTLGLALPDGRYEITPGDDCAAIETWMDVSVYVEFGQPWILTPRDTDWPQCHVSAHAWRDPTPCFKDADVCSVDQEFE